MKASHLYGLLALLVATSCATSPSITPLVSPNTSVAAPDWTARTVFMEGSNLVVVLSGSLTDRPESLAPAALRAYLDLPIPPNTPTVQAQAVEKFIEAMAAVAPTDQFTRGQRRWWKLSIAESTWTEGRAQLVALFQKSNTDPTPALERAADELLRQGQFYDAVSAYAAAAVASVTGTYTAHPERFKALLAKAREVATQFTLSSTTPAQTTRVGQPFGSTFEVRLTYGSGAKAPVLAGVPLRFSYKALVNGRPAVTGQTVRTDKDGVVHFELPAPEFAVKDSLVAVVDAGPWLTVLEDLPTDLRAAGDRLTVAVGDRRFLWPYTVESQAKQVPMAVALADYDEKGSVQRRQESTSALLSGLQKAGFQATGIPVNPTLLKSPNDSVILAAWKFQGRTTGRAVFGTVVLVSVTGSGTSITAEVSGVLKVVDLATSKLVYQLKTSQVATAADKATATAQAYRQWGATAAATLDSDLP